MSHPADTSAVWRLLRRQIPEPWPTHVARGWSPCVRRSKPS